MNIECPHCNTGNTIEFAENISCHKCQKSFAGFSFKKITGSILSTGLLLVGTAFIGEKIDREFFEAKRYPSAAIYEIISYCSSPRDSILHRGTQKELIIKCSCALDKTMPDVSHKDLKRRSIEFQTIFARNLNSCI
ncbi:hypothetical protein ORJ04_20520 [Rheinheimera baltica]|uniref:Uncharacterized protein n=1 Tax=Rheinheimera baltica TaxID=67576 RepID=A0ABT9I4L7_9GAMM|nr:hypothetical protein [Rheinheimera baltica]MDP5138337.1 hypothetical protein [Rheinheimera baltica]MDP5149941.1 hypothetical protein [Rheinheimera baltica]